MLLARCAPAPGEARMEVALSQAALAYLWDHRVAGRALFPAAAMLEAAAAAVLSMLSASSGGLSAQAAVTGASIRAPLVLPSTVQQQQAFISLAVSVLARYGSVEVASATTTRQTHLKAAAACMLPPDEPPPVGCRQRLLSAAIAEAFGSLKEEQKDGRTAVASVAQSWRQPSGQYLIHPAVVDNCTQAGAAVAAPNGSAEQVTRVPAGLHAFAITGRMAAQDSFASATLVGLTADGTAVSDYKLSSNTGGGSAMAISGMLFKPVSQRSAPLSSPSAAAIAGSPQDAVYKLTWAVAEPAAGRVGPPAQRRPLLTWHAMSPGGARTAALLVASSSTGNALAASLRFIQSQAAAGSARAASVRLHTSTTPADAELGCAGASSKWDGAALGEAGASGLLRVAAQEFPGTSWQHYAGSNAAAASSLRPTDAFGTSSQCGLTLAPRLQHSQEPAGKGPFTLGQAQNHIAGSVIVTGGLGDIGSLSAAWAAEARPGAHLYLIGRSGRASQPLPQALLSGAVAVHVVRCDGAQACEVDALVRGIREAGPPLRAVIHAGGVLQDALLPKQVRPSFRSQWSCHSAYSACFGDVSMECLVKCVKWVGLHNKLQLGH